MPIESHTGDLFAADALLSAQVKKAEQIIESDVTQRDSQLQHNASRKKRAARAFGSGKCFFLFKMLCMMT
jgi:hypothetical protein